MGNNLIASTFQHHYYRDLPSEAAQRNCTHLFSLLPMLPIIPIQHLFSETFSDFYLTWPSVVSDIFQMGKCSRISLLDSKDIPDSQSHCFRNQLK